jgi:ADP-heptose:LPS heptosyltransferase
MTLKTRLLIDYYVGGAAHLLIKPVVILFGALLRRDHRLESVREIVVLKLLGGGSLLIAYPSLLALKERAAPGRFRLVTLSGTRDFAEALGVFDEIIVIRDGRVVTLFLDSIRAIWKLWRSDALIDFEVHSRLSTIFCLLTCSRNRIGFYTQVSFWRRGLTTHLLFFHLNSRVHLFYEQVVSLFATAPFSFDKAAETFRQTLALDREPRTQPNTSLAISPCCSDLSPERMMKFEEWEQILRRRIQLRGWPVRIDLLGGPSDQGTLEALRRTFLQAAPGAEVIVHAAGKTLRERIGVLWNAGELLTVDSSLMHIARLLHIPCTSFWGPTSPDTYLNAQDTAPHEIHYQKLPCSPCLHVTARPPCGGQNICMRLAVNPDAPVDHNPPWLANPPLQ